MLPWRASTPADGRWRRDSGAWAALDGLEAPRAVTATVLLEDAAYGPGLQVEPGSHRQATSIVGPGATTTAIEDGLGSVAFFDANLAYAFGRAGDRPYPRMYLVSFNALSQAPGAQARGEPFAACDARVPVDEADDCLWPAPWCSAG